MRLLSYNIHKGIGGQDRRYRLERIIHVIEHENPDLILLQEVTHELKRCNAEDQARVLAEHFALADKMYQLNVQWKVGGYGNLLLSRWPILERHQISLRMNSKKPRGAQIALVETPEGPLKLVNMHLGLAESERRWQIQHLLDHRSFTGIENVPEILAGDYNDWRNMLAGGLFAERGYYHVTSPPSKFRSFPAWFAMGSLDKLFCRGHVSIAEARIVHNAHTRKASDHLPLVVDFHLR